MPGPTNTQFAVAVHVLTYLAGGADGRPVSSDELAASANANPVHIRRVLGPLRRGGLVRSRPGSGGGWLLNRPAHEIALDAVWTLVQEDDPVIRLHGPNPQCPVGVGVKTVLEDVDHDLAHALREHLSRISIGDVVARAHNTRTTMRLR